jgi:uncharacterized protein
MEKITGKRWRRRARRALAATGVLGGGVALGSVGLAYYVARVLTNPTRPGPLDGYTVTPFETGVDFESVAFAPARGDYVLRGWWFPRPETHQVVVACHGYRGSKSEMIGICSALWRAGFNVLTFDFHGHGEAVGAPVTLGYREVQDLLGALDYARTRIAHAALGVIGFSMGASVAIIGSARRADVRCVVADSPFATHASVVAHNVSRVVRVNGRPIVTLADLFIAWRAGYRSRDVEPVREVARIAPRPLLLIHGGADATIPVSHTYRVYAAAGEPKELWVVEGAPHCGAYFADRQAYCRRIAGFFARHLEAGATTGDLSAGIDHETTAS